MKDKSIRSIIIGILLAWILLASLIGSNGIFVMLVSYLIVFYGVIIFYDKTFKVFRIYLLILAILIFVIMYLTNRYPEYSNLFTLNLIAGDYKINVIMYLISDKSLAYLVTFTLAVMVVFMNLISSISALSIMFIANKRIKELSLGESEYFIITDCVNLLRNSTIWYIICEISGLSVWFVQSLQMGVREITGPVLVLFIILVFNFITYKVTLNTIRNSYNTIILGRQVKVSGVNMLEGDEHDFNN